MNVTSFPADAARGDGLPSIVEETRAFRRLTRRVARTLLRQTFSHAWFRLSLVMLLSAILWGGLLTLFYDGFQFLKTTITLSDIRDQAMRGLLHMFFASLTVMLVFSSAIILYGSLFRSRETAFLLTLPAPHRTDLPAQVPKRDHCQQLGILAPGKPGTAGIRVDRFGSLVFFPAVAAVYGGIHLLARGGRQHLLSVAGVLRAAASAFCG